ncbi:DUF2231 domain-containing protein [Marinobacter sp.]|uniref:DUF2231 domain-containing protein n=1 Tax=Marinobacter sp. TaxID=50741 RepID=UPI0035683A3B
MDVAPIRSRMALFGHPIHPMLIHFPVAALLGLIGTDIGYAISGDAFWARAGTWLAAIGMLGGWFSGAIGLLDLVLVKAIRRLVIAWCHGIMAVMLLSLATLNWLLRLGDAQALIVPWGLYVSLLSGVMISITSFLGGQLVYDHAVGVASEKSVDRARRNEEIRKMEEDRPVD